MNDLVLLTGAGGGGGGGGTPGGANTDVQFNSSGSFGGNAGFTYDGTSQVNIGPADATHNGVLGLNGLTSGTATFTAPSVAGTTSNPVVSSNALQIPGGALGTSTLTFAGTTVGLSAAGQSLELNSGGTSPNINFTNGSTIYLQIIGAPTTNTIQTTQAGSSISVKGDLTNQNNAVAITLANGGSYTTTSAGFVRTVGVTGTFAPASGATTFEGLNVTPTINQTSTASGNYTAIKAAVTETSVLGSATGNRLLSLNAGAAGTTEEFGVTAKGNIVTAGTNSVASTVTVSASTTATVTFTNAFVSTPTVVLTPQTTGLTSWFVSAVSNTGFTVTVAPSGTYTFAYHVLGNPN